MNDVAEHDDKDCKIEGCSRRTYAKGLCLTHYQTQWRNTPMLTAVVRANSTCSGCGRRIPDLLPTAWTPSATGIQCPSCAKRVENAETDSRFQQFWDIVRAELDLTPIGYLTTEIMDEPDIEWTGEARYDGTFRWAEPTGQDSVQYTVAGAASERATCHQ